MKMDLQRREILRGIALLSSTIMAMPAIASGESFEGAESDWRRVRAAYPRQTPLLNLNNAGLSPASLVVQREAVRAYEFANSNPDYNMWNVLDGALPATIQKLARLADCDPGEIAINRNTTEGMCTAIFGMPLTEGDRVLVSEWDYPSMIRAWEQRGVRDGIEIKRVTYGLMDSDDAIVAAFARAMTERTKAIQLTHMIHWTGRVVPVKEICQIAREREILTVVDAAQSFAHIPLSFREIGCDYLATSLHKWLCAPFGTGMLIVKAARIGDTWPLLATFEELEGAAKYGMSNLGTYNSAAQFAINPAVDFHNALGTVRVHHRLRELSRHWVVQAADIPGFRIHTPMDSPNLGAVTLFSLDGISIEVIERRLREQHRIQTRFRNVNGLAGVRVSPHLYTSKSELDRFVAALRAIARSA